MKRKRDDQFLLAPLFPTQKNFYTLKHVPVCYTPTCSTFQVATIVCHVTDDDNGVPGSIRLRVKNYSPKASKIPVNIRQVYKQPGTMTMMTAFPCIENTLSYALEQPWCVVLWRNANKVAVS